jgi:GTP diphosphokinase / guanosine-3',5'-bis(diphosphate) 3'-diphosphatase
MSETSSNQALVVRALKFAADKHRKQLRRDKTTPYINHPLAVADILADVGKIQDPDILAAAALHDTIEDTDTTEEELRTVFGARILSLVLECTDDKSLSKAERKRLQVVHAKEKTPGAKQIKIADKISNLNDLVEHPPLDWPLERKMAYIEWANDVFQGLRGINASLDDMFEKTIVHAKRRLTS